MKNDLVNLTICNHLNGWVGTKNFRRVCTKKYQRKQWLCRNKVHINKALPSSFFEIYLQTAKCTDFKYMVLTFPSPRKFPSGFFPVNPLHSRGNHYSKFLSLILFTYSRSLFQWHCTVFFMSGFVSVFYCCIEIDHKFNDLKQPFLLPHNFHVCGIQAWLIWVLCSGTHWLNSIPIDTIGLCPHLELRDVF